MACPDCNKSKGRFCPYCGTEQRAVVLAQGKKEQRFNSKTVIISQMLAAVHIRPYNGTEIIVGMLGDQELIDGAKMEVRAGELMITVPIPFSGPANFGNFGGGFFGGNISVGGGGGFSVINGMVIMDGQMVDMTRAIKVLVAVPYGTNVKIGKLIGGAFIEDIGGDLHVRASGRTIINAGVMRSASINIQGSCETTIAEVSGDVQCQISGSGSVTISRGSCTTFTANISGSGSVVFSGKTQNADLGVSGSGNIFVAESVNITTKRKSGSGHITVAKEPKDTSSAFSVW